LTASAAALAQNPPSICLTNSSSLSPSAKRTTLEQFVVFERRVISLSRGPLQRFPAFLIHTSMQGEGPCASESAQFLKLNVAHSRRRLTSTPPEIWSASHPSYGN